MKKTALLALSLAVILAGSTSPAVVSASGTTSGTINDVVRWSYNRMTGVLTFRALQDGDCSLGITIYEGRAYLDHSLPEGTAFNEESYYGDDWLAPWEDLNGKVRTMTYDANIYLPADAYWQKLVSTSIRCEQANGFSWEYTCGDQTLTYSGNGPLSYRHYLETDEAIQLESSFDAFPHVPCVFPSTVVLSDGITEVYTVPECDTLVLGDTADLSSSGFFRWNPADPVREAFQVDADNPYYTGYEGALYSKDCKTLLMLPSEMDYLPAHPDLEIMGTGCCPNGAYLGSTFVVPWGVTTLEPGSLPILTEAEGAATYILPDTLVTIGDDGISRSADTHRIFSIGNDAAMNTYAFLSSAALISDRGAEATWSAVPSVASYYGIQPGGWVTRGSRSWYIGEDGKMVKGEMTIDGERYTFDAHGLLITDGQDAESEAGFVTRDGRRYFYQNGTPVKGQARYIDGRVYLFDRDGVMQADGWYQLPDGQFIYLTEEGTGDAGCWRYRDGHFYQMQADGTITTAYNAASAGYSYLGTDGQAVVWDWVQDGEDWYYLNAWGVRYQSMWQKINGSWYWFGGSGKMARSEWLQLDGRWYYFTDSGAMAHDVSLPKDGKTVYIGSDGAME